MPVVDLNESATESEVLCPTPVADFNESTIYRISDRNLLSDYRCQTYTSSFILDSLSRPLSVGLSDTGRGLERVGSLVSSTLSKAGHGL